jgi:hypothetical protein
VAGRIESLPNNRGDYGSFTCLFAASRCLFTTRPGSSMLPP